MIAAHPGGHLIMERNVLYIVIVVLVLGIGIGAFAWYQHRQNTLLEVNVGNHGLSVEKQ